MKEQFIQKNFRDKSLALINAANEIIDEYRAQGFTLTLRQLYYQFVARDLIPNTMRSYKSLGNTINDARLAGLIDWLSIEDRTRNVVSLAHWDSPADIISTCRDQYRRDLWADQARRVEVWIEKEALTGVIDRVCRKLDVPYFACRGYVSQSEQWRAYQRSLDDDILILHFGDHDPSGIDMTRDNDDRLNRVFGGNVEMRRVALNMNQVEQYNPPPNPAKQTDSRFESYAQEFGDESWELDALEPSVINDLIEKEVLAERNDDIWQDSLDEQESEREIIGQIVDDLDD